MFRTKAVEKIKTHILFYPPPENRSVYGMMWKNVVEPERSQMTIWCMRVSRWVPKATNKRSQIVCYCFSTVTVVARMRLTVTLWYIACLVFCVL
jgi:hypothetical protein